MLLLSQYYLLYDIRVRWLLSVGLRMGSLVTRVHALPSLHLCACSDPEVMPNWYDYTNNLRDMNGFEERFGLASPK